MRDKSGQPDAEYQRTFLHPAMQCPCSVAILLALLLVFPSRLCLAADSSLAILDAGVQRSEDAPFAASDFQFLPGDYLYFSFQIGGFTVKSDDQNEIRKISLSYEVTPEDSNGIALATASTGAIDEELNPEDKNWMPKRRTSFLLPSFVPAGDFRVHVLVKDLVAKTETSKDFPFRMGGVVIQASNGIAIQNLQFFRKERDRDPVQVPAYSPGDTVYARFNMAGFKTGEKNEYHLSYGVTVLRPDGKSYINQPKAAELQASTFYPARYLPGVAELTTSSASERGEYVLVLTVNDLIGNQSSQTKSAFSIE